MAEATPPAEEPKATTTPAPTTTTSPGSSLSSSVEAAPGVDTEQSKEGYRYNGAGTIVGVTCTECGRVMEGDTPTVCDACSGATEEEKA